MVRRSDHPLGMTVLDFQDAVAGYGNLNEEIVRKLMAADDLRVVPHSLQERVLGRLITSPNALVADVSGSVVVATGHWVVSIHGDSLIHCVDALLKYRNAVATQLSATVTGQLTTLLAENSGPLHRVVVRRVRKQRVRNFLNKACWLAAGALVGCTLTLIVEKLIGG